MDPDTENEGEASLSDEQRRQRRLALEARRARTVRSGQLVGGTLMAVVAAGVLLRLPAEWWVPLVGLVALAGLVLRLVTWTCPECGERLPTRGTSGVCRGCGLPLE